MEANTHFLLCILCESHSIKVNGVVQCWIWPHIMNVHSSHCVFVKVAWGLLYFSWGADKEGKCNENKAANVHKHDICAEVRKYFLTLDFKALYAMYMSFSLDEILISRGHKSLWHMILNLNGLRDFPAAFLFTKWHLHGKLSVKLHSTKKTSLTLLRRYLCWAKCWSWWGFIAVFYFWLFLKYLFFTKLVWIHGCFLDILPSLSYLSGKFWLQSISEEICIKKEQLRVTGTNSAAFNLLLWITVSLVLHFNHTSAFHIS